MNVITRPRVPFGSFTRAKIVMMPSMIGSVTGIMTCWVSCTVLHIEPTAANRPIRALVRHGIRIDADAEVDLDFIAQYLQLVHSADKPDILDVSTLHVLDKAARLGVLPQAAVEVLRPAARLYQDLTQILRLCVTEKFKPETAGEDLLRIMARAGDAPDFSSLEARVKETQGEVRRVFRDLLEGGN